ncbi:response regulator [Georgenia yuyongxinii]|uniref:Response regulator transcription factor n=1 Tax=Georgenia yuyongxinii TaxID=2589797 RepID=A0A552WWZ3_9MICO|nr:response regulator transcription factor [Georgenia yuyongxinii]TRW47322.1 response regulator transcription factor [Georgenia yuyongxinii]
MAGTVRVVLVEDHPIVRAGARLVIERHRELGVVGETGTVTGALRLVVDAGPDVVVLPMRLQGRLCGTSLCAAIKDRPAPPAVVVFTAFAAPEHAAAALLAGADGFVHKGAEPASLLQAVRAAHVRPGPGPGVEEDPGSRPGEAPAEPAGGPARLVRAAAGAGLTRREREVLCLMLQHLSNDHIARDLYLGLPTVKTHVRHVLRKLGLAHRAELFRAAGLT